MRDPLVGELFDEGVLALSCALDAGDDDLFGEECALVERAVAKRRREFATGRRAARELLARLGFPHAPLLRGVDRAPAWPAGVVGSISHCDDRCFVAVAPARVLAGIGVDVEPDRALAPELWPHICSEAELARLETCCDVGRNVRLAFSAKEALYKCIHPLVRESLGFHDVEVDFDWETRRFEARTDGAWLARLPGERLPAGRFLRRIGYVFTAATLPAI